MRKYLVQLFSKNNLSIFEKILRNSLLVFPLFRAIRKIRLGGISDPLQDLSHMSCQFGISRSLEARLKDMHEFLLRESGNYALVLQREERKPFNNRVLYAFHSCGAFDPSGYASRSVSLVHSMSEFGVEPSIVVRPGYPWDLPHHSSKAHLEIVRYQSLDFKLLPNSDLSLKTPESEYIVGYARWLKSVAIADGVSVIHASSNYINGCSAALAAHALGITSVYELRGLWHLTRAFSCSEYGQSEHFQYVEKRELQACLSVDRVVTISQGLKHWLIERGIPPQKIDVIGNAATPPEPKRVNSIDVSALRNRLDIPDDAKVVGYIGSLVGYEGLEFLIHALFRTPRSRRPYVLLVGGGHSEPDLRSLAKELGVGDKVVFAGRVAPDEVTNYYLAMDLVTLPRRDDLLTRLVPAIKPFEVVAHQRPLAISPALAIALRGTLETGFKEIDFENIECLDELFEFDYSVSCDTPDWPARARSFIEVYKGAEK